MKEIRIFSPATVANISCGFDIMGFALENLGDEMFFCKNNSRKVTISKIEGADLPFNSNKNVAGFVAQKMLQDSQADFGVDIQIFKKYKPGSGLGSSAASSAGVAFAINKFLGNKYSQLELVKFSKLGEEVACGSPIVDNVSAALYGGFVLIRSNSPLDIISIPTPEDLFVTIIHPQIELKTEEGRKMLPKEVLLTDATIQWANVGGLISGLYRNDYNLIGRSLEDVIVEPIRKKLIPYFDEIKQMVMNNGALGAGISGSGPSVFALSKGEKLANTIAEKMKSTYKNKNIEFNVYVSKIGNQGVRILN